MAVNKNLKIVLVGDGGVGKTTFIKHHRTGHFEQKYIATQGVDVYPLTFKTNYGQIIFKVWDCAGQEKFRGLQEEYYCNADGAIAMFDLGSKLSCNNVFCWINNVRSVVPNIPVIICGNKFDLPDKKVTGRIQAQDLQNVKYYQISTRSTLNYDKPFLELARKLTGHEDLEWTEIPAIFGPRELDISCSVSDHQKTVCAVSDDQKTVCAVSDKQNKTCAVIDQQKTVCAVSDDQKTVCWVEIPGGGGMMKITYEFYPCASKW